VKEKKKAIEFPDLDEGIDALFIPLSKSIYINCGGISLPRFSFE